MIIENRWFAFQGPYRADLSGRPFGLLFIWFGGVGRLDTMAGRDRFGRHPHAREFGIWLPKLPRLRKTEPLECSQLIEADSASHDWRQWPEPYRKVADAAVARALAERPGRKIVRDASACDRRIDLSGAPLQLWRAIEVDVA